MIETIKTKLGPKKIQMVEWSGKNIPKTLYKFRDWKNDFHKRMILHQELFVPTPNSFNDPHDCRIPPAYHWLSKNEEFRNDYFEYLIDKFSPDLNEKKRELEIKTLLEDPKFFDSDYIQKLKDDYVNGRNETLGVYCLTAVMDNILMWAHYSNNHTGFCIGFDSRKLFEYFPGTGGDVIYKENFPEVSPLAKFPEKLLSQYYTKASFWDYEIEYRLTKDGLANQTIQLNKSIITEIIIGYNIKQSDKEDILKIIKLELPHVKVFQTQPSIGNFNLEIKEI